MTKETQKLCEIFRELQKVKDKLSPKIFEDIRLRLAEGSSYKTMFPAMIEENRKLLIKNMDAY